MLYHKQLGFPKSLDLPINKLFELTYSSHAVSEATIDRYGRIKLPSSIVVSKWNIIEVETQDNLTTSKVLVRIPHCSKFDLIMAILANGTVKTAWLNSSTDRHMTLDKSKYDRFKN